jgi:hypothetical protein
LGISAWGILRSRPNVWKPDEDRLLGTERDEMIGRRIGRSAKAVKARRYQLRIPTYNPKNASWTAQEEKIVGTKPDKVVAVRLGRSVKSVVHRRLKLGLPPCGSRHLRGQFRWTDAENALLGMMPDAEVAKQVNRSCAAVADRRWALKIPAFRPPSDHSTR